MISVENVWKHRQTVLNKILKSNQLFINSENHENLCKTTTY